MTLGAWSLASPPASSPDDLFHLPSIWCAHGYDSRCIPVPQDPTSRAVPPYASAPATCFTGHPTDSAACQDKILGHHKPNTVTGGNWRHDYPPVYYWIMGWLVTDRYQLSILLMRLTAGTVVVGLVAWLTAAVPRQMKHVAAVPLVALTVPLGLFLLASNNPSGWAIGSAAIVWPALHAALNTEDRRRWQLYVIAVLGAVVGAGSRADACVFTVMAVGLAVLLNLRRLRSHPLATAVAAGCALLAFGFFAGAGQAQALSTGLNPGQIIEEQSRLGVVELTLNNFVNMPMLWGGVVASGPFGATGTFDVGFPYVVGFLVVTGVTVLVYASWRRPAPNIQLALGAAVTGLFVYPLYILAKTHLIVGQGIQPRYVLPILIMILGLVLLNSGPRLRRATALFVAGVLIAAHCLALHVQMRRYISGQDVSHLNLDREREWWWNLPVSPTLVWVVGSVGFALTAYLALRLCVARPDALREDADVEPARELTTTGSRS
jgi:hypothetical protein